MMLRLRDLQLDSGQQEQSSSGAPPLIVAFRAVCRPKIPMPTAEIANHQDHEQP